MKQEKMILGVSGEVDLKHNGAEHERETTEASDS